MKTIPELSFLRSRTKEAVEEMNSFKGTLWLLLCECNSSDSFYFHFFLIVNKMSFAFNYTFSPFMKTFKCQQQNMIPQDPWNKPDT